MLTVHLTRRDDFGEFSKKVKISDFFFKYGYNEWTKMDSPVKSH